MRHCNAIIAIMATLIVNSNFVQAQFLISIDEIKIVEQESAEAKRVRLDFIQRQVDEIQVERREYEAELEELRQTLPTVRPSNLSAAAVRQQEQDQRNFQQWFSVPNSTNRYSIASGRMLNLAIRVLGPVASKRKDQKSADDNFASFNAAHQVTADDARRLHLVAEMTTGSQAVTRLNAPPLEIEWPLLVVSHWPRDCQTIENLRDAFADKISMINQGPPSNEDRRVLQQTFELLDQRLELLEAHVNSARNRIAKSFGAGNDYTEMGVALRYVKRIRATANRFRQAPSEFRERRFVGGNIEDFVVYCYAQGLTIGEAAPDDEAQYMKLYDSIRSYAHDIWQMEDLRTELQLRIANLSSYERELMDKGATDAATVQ